MRLSDLRISVQPGDGLVASFGTAVVLALAPEARQEPFLEGLLSMIETELAEQPAEPGRRVARQLVGRLSESEPADVPSFCVIADVNGGAAVILHGSVDLQVTGPGGSERLSGQQVATWVDRIIESPFDRLAVGSSGAPPPEPDRRSDLRGGVVSGAGVVLAPRTADFEDTDDAHHVLPMSKRPPQAPSPPAGPSGWPLPKRPLAPPGEEPSTEVSTGTESQAPVRDEKPPSPQTPPGGLAVAQPPDRVQPASQFVSVPLHEPLPKEELAPLPKMADEPKVAPPASATVEGILCPVEHLNDPRASYCSSCGRSLVHRTHNLVKGSRPPLGVLVLRSGATFVLDGDYTVGREPELDEEVGAGKVRPLELEDPKRAVSRVHARVTLHGWDIKVTDINSANGTYLAGPNEVDWTRLPPGEPRTIEPGTRILVGDQPLVFESHHRGRG